MDSKPHQYLIYLSLILAVVSIYTSLMGGKSLDSEVAISEVVAKGEISPSELSEMITQLARRVDKNASAKDSNANSINNVLETTGQLKTEMNALSSTTTGLNRFIQSYNNGSTELHGQISDLESKLDVLTSLETITGGEVEVDETFVRNIGTKVSLLETSLKTTKESALAAKGTSNVNAGVIATMKASVENLHSGYDNINILEGKVVALSEKLNTDSSGTAIESITKRVNGLTLDRDNLDTRVSDVEDWVESRKNADLSASTSSSASSGEISQAVINRLAAVEQVSGTNKTNISNLSGNTEVDTSFISELDTKLQKQITENKEEIASVLVKTNSNLNNVTTQVNPRLDTIETKLGELDQADETWKNRIEALEGVEPQEIVPFVQQPSPLEAHIKLSGPSLSFTKNIALNQNGLRFNNVNDSTWMAYLASNGDTASPTGKKLSVGYNFNGWSTRIRTRADIASGIIFEDSNEKMLMSVRAVDAYTHLAGPLNVQDNTAVFSNGTVASFAHKNHMSVNNSALRQGSDGVTVLSSPKYIKIKVEGLDNIICTKSKTMINHELVVNHASGTHDTHFRANGNYISTGAGKKNYFRFGAGDPSVTIQEKEVTIDGVNVLQTIKTLQKQVADLTTALENAVKYNDSVRLANGYNNLLLRKLNGTDNTVRADTRSKTGYSRFQIQKP